MNEVRNNPGEDWESWRLNKVWKVQRVNVIGIKNISVRDT